jgi:hypothetical protein
MQRRSRAVQLYYTRQLLPTDGCHQNVRFMRNYISNVTVYACIAHPVCDDSRADDNKPNDVKRSAVQTRRHQRPWLDVSPHHEPASKAHVTVLHRALLCDSLLFGKPTGNGMASIIIAVVYEVEANLKQSLHIDVTDMLQFDCSDRL